MEAQIERPHDGAIVPPYEAWPSAPKGPLRVSGEVANPSGMDVDSVASPDTVNGRATSVLSMDDLEAAQALEGLRTGILFLSLGFEGKSHQPHCRLSELSRAPVSSFAHQNRFRTSRP